MFVEKIWMRQVYWEVLDNKRQASTNCGASSQRDFIRTYLSTLIGSLFQGRRVCTMCITHATSIINYFIWLLVHKRPTIIHPLFYWSQVVIHDHPTGLTWCELSRVFEAPSLDPLTRFRDCDLDLALDLPGTPLNSEILPFRPCGIELRLPIELMEPLPDASPFARNTSSSVKSFFTSSSL